MADLIATAQRAPFVSFEEATFFLEETARRSAVKHLSYWYLRFVEELPDQVVWVATYDPNYMNQYMKNFTPLGDPVMAEMHDGRIVDWTEWIPTDNVSSKILVYADKFDVPKFGISMHIPTHNNDKVVFSVCLDCDDVIWPHTRRNLVQRFKPFAVEFHERMAPMINARQKGDAVYAF